MNWIQRRWDQFALLVCAMLLLAFSALLISKAMGFGGVFDALKGDVVKSTEVQPVDTSFIENAEKQIQEPPQWSVSDKDGSIFVARKYIVKEENGILTLVDVLEPGSPDLYPGVPNTWFTKFDLPILETNVLDQDQDGDKFTNREEFEGKTDPIDPQSHPPFWQKLRLKEFTQTKFRLLFSAYTGDPLNPDSLTFQINTLDVNQPTQFLKLGNPIEGTKFKIEGFAFKSFVNENNITRDISELTVKNEESGDSVILVVEKIANSPDSFAVFHYLIDGSEFKTQLGKSFKLPPAGTEYIVVDINPSRAVIQDTQSGEKHDIPKLESAPSPAGTPAEAEL